MWQQFFHVARVVPLYRLGSEHVAEHKLGQFHVLPALLGPARAGIADAAEKRPEPLTPCQGAAER